MRTLLMWLCTLALAGAGCDETDETESTEPAAGREGSKERVEKEPGDEPDDELDSCAVLTEKLVRDQFGIAADVEVEQSTFEMRHHTCTYRWEKANADEVRADVEKKRAQALKDMMRNMRKGKKAQGLMDMATDMPTTDNEVALTIANFELDSEEQAQQRFRGVVKMLNEGIKRNVKTKNVDEEVELKAEGEPVDGVGDLASWTPRMSQLSAVDGKHIFHVVVKIHQEPEANLRAAKQLAARVIPRL